jgi:serine/threonine-protein kinase
MKKLSTTAGTALASTAMILTVASAPAEAATIRSYKSVAAGTCLDSNASRQAYTHSCNTGNFQDWVVTGSDSATQFKNVATGYCLDSNAAGQVYTNPCSSSNKYQTWTVLRFSDGVTMRFRNVATGRTLTATTGSPAGLRTEPWNGGSLQKWRRA